MTTVFLRFLPFWIFLVFFKFAGALHYSLISPLGNGLLPLWVVGLLMGGGSIVQLLLDVPAGRMLDRYGYVKFLKITTFVFLFAGVALLFGLTEVTYLASVVAATFGWVFFGPGMNAYVLSYAPTEHAGKFISLRDVYGSVGVVLASATLPLVLLLPVRTIGAVLVLLFAVSYAALSFAPRDVRPLHEETKLPTHHYYVRRSKLRDMFRAMRRLNPASGMLLLSGFVASIFYGVIWFVVPLVIATQGNSELLGIGLGMFDFAVVMLGFFLGGLADRANRRTLVFFGLLIFSVAGLLLGFNFGWLFLLFGFLATSGDEMAGISLWSWLHALDKEHDRDGLISGVINLFDDLGWAIGPIAAGALYVAIGPTWTIVAGALPIFATWLVYQFLVGAHDPRLPHAGPVPTKPHRARHRT